MTYREFRDKVSVIDVAEHLGYAHNKQKGRMEGGKVEYKHPSGDTVIISNPRDTPSQLYFNRDGSTDRGSVIDFVANRLDKFPGRYATKTEGINAVLSDFANNPQTYRPNTYTPTAPKPFEASRYELTPATAFKLHYLIKERGLELETVNRFLPHIQLVRDLTKEPGKDYTNIAFPLTKPGEKEIIGLDVRNYGFKSVAAGSDRANGAWIADFSADRALTTNVFLAENPIDAMSFYQLNRSKINVENAAFVSFGGGISKSQLAHVLEHWPDATKHTAFDNDYQGRIYDVTVAAAISGKQVSFRKDADSLAFTVGEYKKFDIPVSQLNLQTFERLSGIRSNVQVHKAHGFKDFNDVIHPARSQKEGAKLKL